MLVYQNVNPTNHHPICFIGFFFSSRNLHPPKRWGGGIAGSDPSGGLQGDLTQGCSTKLHPGGVGGGRRKVAEGGFSCKERSQGIFPRNVQQDPLNGTPNLSI